MSAQDWIDSHPQYLPIIFPIFFVCMWVTVSYVLGFIGGWHELAQRFRLQSSFRGLSWTMQSARMRLLGGYSNCITVGCNDDGLYLAMLFFFRVGHPPLLIPWNEVSVSREKGILFRYVNFRLGRIEQVPLRVRESLGDNLRIAAGTKWPPERPSTG